MSGRRGNNGRGRGGANLKASLGMLKSSLHGHANDLKAVSPPSFTRIPFNTIVVESTLATPTTPLGVSAANNGEIKVKDIILALKEQINIPLSTFPAPELVTIMIKIKRIDLWSSVGSGSQDPPTIKGKFFGLTQFVALIASAQAVIVNPIKSLENVGLQGSDSAVVSYTYPRDQADVALSDVGAVPVCLWQRSKEDQTVIARYHIFWSTADSTEVVLA